MEVEKSDRNDKLLEKRTSSSYHMEQKTFIEASCIYNIHTVEKNFYSCYFWRFVSRFRLELTLVRTSLQKTK